MNNLLEPGRYVVAVSGGVDSVVLVHMLKQDENLQLSIAHFDHGIRDDSPDDAEFVRRLAEKDGLHYFTDRKELGSNASEAQARKYRYEFLHSVRKKVNATAVVTAHHQDDLIETALLNLLRGTKRRGLVSLRSTATLKRPLLNMSKADLKQYAERNGLEWREDSTNRDVRYKRNRIRLIISQNLDSKKRKEITGILKSIDKQNTEIEEVISKYLAAHPPDRLDKTQLSGLPASEASEIVAQWLRLNEVSFDRKAVARLIEGAKNLQNGAQIDIQQNSYCAISKNMITLKRR